MTRRGTTPTVKLPADGCEEASPFSDSRYVPCGRTVHSLVDNGDSRAYWMCEPCSTHNVHNRGATVIAVVTS